MEGFITKGFITSEENTKIAIMEKNTQAEWKAEKEW